LVIIPRILDPNRASIVVIFIATLWAAAGRLFFGVARSSRIDSDMLVTRVLKNSQLACGERRAISRTGH